MDSDREFRDTISEMDTYSPVPEVQNTYRLGPTEEFPFAKVRRIMIAVLQANFADMTYEPTSAGGACMNAPEQIIAALDQQENLSRYNIVCQVVVGQSDDQSLLLGSRCLWDQKHDKMVTAQLSLKKYTGIFAMAFVYALYSE